MQANERTMLAWIRTSLALITFGFVIARIGAWLGFLTPAAASSSRPSSPEETAWIGTVFVAVGAVTNVMAVWRYAVARRAIRAGGGVRDDIFPFVFAVIVTGLSAIVGAHLLLRVL